MRTELHDRDELQLLEQVNGVLQEIHSDIACSCNDMLEGLRTLSTVFSNHPSILDRRQSGDETQSLSTLIETLYQDGCNHTVLLPTKVVVGRAYMVAKFNFFGFLRALCDRHRQLAPFRDELQRGWEYTIFSLLIEDVYQAIIERDGQYAPEIRRQAAIDLIHFWEHRFDRNVTEYAPALVDLWRVRKRVAPVFGTMLGTMELLKISSLLSDRWHSFLTTHGSDPETVQALEEFVFGLLYESIAAVRSEMLCRHQSVIDRDTLQQMLGDDALPEEVSGVDPREMYRFYQRRARQAERRSIANQPGPRRTLEERLLVFLIEEKRRRAS